MAGLFFALFKEPDNAPEILSSAYQMLRFPWLQIKTHISNHFAVASVFPKNYLPIFYHDPITQDFTAVFGEFYLDDKVKSEKEITSWISKQCASNNQNFLKNCNGLYNLVHWNNNQKELTIANDCTGALLLFETKIQDTYLWSSEPGLLNNYPGFDTAIDFEAATDILNIGYTPGNKTSFKSMTVVPPASVIRIKISSSKFEKTVTTGVDFSNRSSFSYIDQFQELFEDSLRLRFGDGNENTITLPLSGGEDSRLILAGMQSIGTKTKTVTLRSCQVGDAYYGSAAAQVAGVPNTIYEMDTHLSSEDITFLQNAFSSTMDWHCIVMYNFLKTFATQKIIPIGFLGGTLAGASPKVNSLIGLQESSNYYTGNYSATVKSILNNLYGRQRRYTSYFFRMAWNFGKPVCPFSDSRIIQLSLSLEENYYKTQKARRIIFNKAYNNFARLKSGNDQLAIHSIHRRKLRNALSGTFISYLIKNTFNLNTTSFHHDLYLPVFTELFSLLDKTQRSILGSIINDNTTVCQRIAAVVLLLHHGEILKKDIL